MRAEALERHCYLAPSSGLMRMNDETAAGVAATAASPFGASARGRAGDCGWVPGNVVFDVM